MDSITLEELKELEKSTKNKIIVKYNNILPKEKVDYLLDNEFFNKNNYSSSKSIKKYNGELLRHIFSILINITTEKESVINENEIKITKNGTDLETGLIEYYTKLIANEFNLEINERPDLKSKLKLAEDLANKLGSDFDNVVFNNITEEIYDDKSNDETNEKNNKPSLTLLYENEEQFIKYIDDNNELHLVKSNNPKKVSKLYKQLSDKNTDLKEMFEKLTNVKSEKNTKNEEINILDFIEQPIENEMEINETVIEDVISDISDNEKIDDEVKTDYEITNKDENIQDEMNFDEYEKTLLEGVLEPIIENDNSTDKLSEKTYEDKFESKNDEDYDFDKTGFIEVINENTYNEFNNNENKITQVTLDNEKIDKNVDEDTKKENVEESEKTFLQNNNDLEEITEEKSLENNDKAEEIKENDEEKYNVNIKQDGKNKKSKDETKEDMYMIFYIFAITISVALIIGIIILKFYS